MLVKINPHYNPIRKFDNIFIPLSDGVAMNLV